MLEEFEAFNVLLAEVSEVAALEDAHRLLGELTELVGFETYSYVGGSLLAGERFIGFDHGNPDSRPVVLANVSRKFYDAYAGDRMDHYDLVLRLAMRSSLPRQWDQAAALARSKQQKRVFELSHEFDMRNGLILPIHGPGADFGVLSLSGPVEETPGPRTLQMVPWASLFAQQLHVQVRERLSGSPANDQVLNVSQREMDVLTLQSQGKSAWEIAQILEVSEDTVRRHAKNVRAKLDVVNTAQAVAKIMTIRLKEPI